MLNPDSLENGVVTRVSSVWSVYDGDEIYGDFTATGSPPTVTNVQSFELGVGKFSWSGGVPSAATRQYYHTDMIGTTRFMSNSAGSQVDPAVYTAFGERISGTNHRYGYAMTSLTRVGCGLHHVPLSIEDAQRVGLVGR